MRHIRRLAAVLTLVAAMCVSASLFACAAPSSGESDVEYAATVQALLPTSESPSPSAPRSNTPLPPADTPVPAADTPAPPTYTPRPLPTYTPRPVPLPAGERERADAIPFQAQTLDGSQIALSDTFGAPTLLAFWAPW